jgi:hypothetical protein
MPTNRTAVHPNEAWKIGRAGTIPITALWTGAAGAALNTAGIGGTGTFVIGGVTVVATIAASAGMWAKGLNEKELGQRGVNAWQNLYVTTCTCAAGSWITWASATLPWAPYTAGSLVAGTLAAWLLYPWFRSSRREAIAAEHAAAFPTTTDRDLTAWEQITEQARLKGMQEVEKIDTPGGYLVRMKLPQTGTVTFKNFLSKLDTLSVIAGHQLNLRSGALRAEPGANDAEVLLHVTERDVLAELIPLPHDLALIDSNEPFDIGLHEDATALHYDFLRHGMIVGVTDSGKSNTLNVIIKKGGQMVDTLLWVIDPKGGRMIRPWIQPLLDGKVQRSVLDWVATNGGPTTMGTEGLGGQFKLNKSPDEYHHLLDTAIAEMDRRANLALGGEKVTTSPDLPRIVIIIDEAADVLGDNALKEKCKLIVRKGRSEGIMLLIAGQRGTASMLGDGDFRSQIQNAIGLGVRSQTDANMVFPGDSDISKILPKLAHQGTLAIKRGAKGRAIPGKGYRIEPDHIEALVIALSGRRPGLPADAVAFHGSVYTDRWSTHRIQHLFVSSSDQINKPDPTPPATARPASTTRTPSAPSAPASDRRSALDNFIKRGQNKNQPPDNPAPGIEVGADGEAIAADFQRFLADFPPTPGNPATTPNTPAPEPGIDPRRALVRRIVRDAGPHGAQTEDLWSALTAKFGTDWNRSVVTTWITEDCRTGIMHRPIKGRIVNGPKPLDEQAPGERP